MKNPQNIVLALLAAALLSYVAHQHPGAVAALTIGVAVFIGLATLLP